MHTRALLACIAASSLMISCTTDNDEKKEPSADLKRKTVATYADIVYNSYLDAREAGVVLETAINAFVTAPSPATQDAAKQAWFKARIPYGQTEVYRFYDGPIDNATDGPEPLMNSWPLDESYIDYVEGDDTAGIINMTGKFPDLSLDLLSGANGPGEADIATGYHAIEFLLWGQDLEAASALTAGHRPYTDYVVGEEGTASNQARRGAYLKLAAQLLVDNLDFLVAAWKPNAANYRAEFLAANPDASLAKILIGMGSLSGAELSGERMTVAMDNGDQEDEHSCFSDNTNLDIVFNDQGISNVFNGSYERTDGTKVTGTGLYDLLKASDADLADKLKDQLAQSLKDAKLIDRPFDNAISLANTAGRAKVRTTINALMAQAATIPDAAEALGIIINLD